MRVTTSGAAADPVAPRVKMTAEPSSAPRRPIASVTAPLTRTPTIAPSSNEATVTCCIPEERSNSGVMKSRAEEMIPLS